MTFRRKEKEPRYTLAEYSMLYAVVAEQVTAMNAEARKANMVEQGLLPQSHLSRADLMKHREQLDADGRTELGRRFEGTPEDPDLTARD